MSSTLDLIRDELEDLWDLDNDDHPWHIENPRNRAFALCGVPPTRPYSIPMEEASEDEICKTCLRIYYKEIGR